MLDFTLWKTCISYSLFFSDICNMGKLAITIDKQIDLLLKRGLKIDDRDKATEILMDIID